MWQIRCVALRSVPQLKVAIQALMTHLRRIGSHPPGCFDERRTACFHRHTGQESTLTVPAMPLLVCARAPTCDEYE
jgi:hypothetical protein